MSESYFSIRSFYGIFPVLCTDNVPLLFTKLITLIDSSDIIKKTMLPFVALALLCLCKGSAAFCTSGPFLLPCQARPALIGSKTACSSSSSDDDDATIEFETEEEKKEAVGNLVADDEWLGLSMELGDVIRTAVVQDLKSNAREFLGKDDYKLGDFSKEIDVRVKREVALMRGKEQYELGDLTLAIDSMSKNFTETLTGKPYETGDLSKEIDKRVKKAVANYCGKDEYEFGDLSREISARVGKRVEEFTGKSYEFGDVSREIWSRRKSWMKDYLGEEAAENYQFGDITKKFVAGFTDKDDYEFGDISKKLLGNLFGNRKRK